MTCTHTEDSESLVSSACGNDEHVHSHRVGEKHHSNEVREQFMQDSESQTHGSLDFSEIVASAANDGQSQSFYLRKICQVLERRREIDEKYYEDHLKREEKDAERELASKNAGSAIEIVADQYSN